MRPVSGPSSGAGTGMGKVHPMRPHAAAPERSPNRPAGKGYALPPPPLMPSPGGPLGAGPSSGLDSADAGPSKRSRFKLRHILFLCLLLSGIIPLAISSTLLMQQNRGLLVEQQREYLVNSAEALSREVSLKIAAWRGELAERGSDLLNVPGREQAEPGTAEWVDERLREAWVESYLGSFVGNQNSVLRVRALSPSGQGPQAVEGVTGPEVQAMLNDAFAEVAGNGNTLLQLATFEGRTAPLVVLSVPVGGVEGGEPALIMQSVSRLEMESSVVENRRAESGVTVMLADDEGSVLWVNEGGEELAEFVEANEILATAGGAVISTEPFEVRMGDETKRYQRTTAGIEGTRWQVAVMKPDDVAFAAANKMIYNTLLSSVLLVLLALLTAAFVARWVGEPLQRLAESTHAIAAGDFGHRLDNRQLTFEMAELAENFNRMGDHVESYIDRLKEAARVNHELFLGSIRAFAATIDAKDPYTRGHSERVAAMSRAVARHMGLDEDFQQRVWLGALLHDVGKIGIDDRILKKGAGLTPEEYEEMKLHTVIGAEIVGRLERLKEIVPAVRWHHENWNGNGYPDGLKGEQIPLIARIICVADTFDAVTTSRPYQQAYTLEFAVDTITKLTGSRFDAKVVTAFLSAFHAGQIEAAIQRGPDPVEELPPEVNFL